MAYEAGLADQDGARTGAASRGNGVAAFGNMINSTVPDALV